MPKRTETEPSTDMIKIVGARTHNLKNLTVTIPKNRVTIITGLSGSGKSSLAFDTIFAEGQRRYIESLSSFVRQFLSEIEKPDFDYIEGLAPAIAIDQKTAGRNPRSTVATTTEIYDFLRLLFSRIGRPFCPNCQLPVTKQTEETISQLISREYCSQEYLRVKVFAIAVWRRKGEHKYQLKAAKKQGTMRVRYDAVEMDLDEALNLEVDKQKAHTVELLTGQVDFPVSNDQSHQVAKVELLKLISKALRLGNGMLTATDLHGESQRYYSQKYACSRCGWQFPEIEPRLFSFNNPEGACRTCLGLGMQMMADPQLVIPNPRLTLAEGAIRPWSRTTSHSNWHQKALNELAKKYQFSLDTAVGELGEKNRKLILDGEPEEEGGNRFEGVLPNLERRYRETDSEYLKNEIEKYMVERQCQTCHGQRLRSEVLSIKIKDKNIIDLTILNIAQAGKFFDRLVGTLKETDQKIAAPIVQEILCRLEYLLEVGLGYVTLNRTTSTLAGGEAQRVRLATQLGSGLTGVIYILDEPSIGLHARDHQKLLKTIGELRDRGNTVIVVEHDRETMLEADHIIDMGPGAGEQGGKIIAEGTPEEIVNNPRSLTGAYLANRKRIELPNRHPQRQTETLTITGATGNNLKNLTVTLPLNKFICVTGVSGSGKSTLIEDTLAAALTKHFHRSSLESKPHQSITGSEGLDNIINVDQSPIGRTPRSNPATYTGTLGPIRELFANTSEAQSRGYDPSRFSFNLRGGRCENCHGDGQIKIEMNFLPDVYVTCSECRGKRYNLETLEIKYQGKDISDILEMTIDEASEFFAESEEVISRLRILRSVGLGYMKLGQSATTLSGGEAQRIKLATELAKRETGKTLYILDEPTTGLHFEDIQKLLIVLYQLVDRGNTVIVIEHNLEVIACADWIVDLGPGGGDQGGELVAEGTPEDLAKNPQSITGAYLRRIISAKASLVKA